jgi:molybdate-binding protein
VEAAARQFELDFVRLLTEDYFFVCRKDILEMEVVKRILKVMQGREFHAAISQVPGYQVKDPGVIKTIGEVFRKSE